MVVVVVWDDDEHHDRVANVDSPVVDSFVVVCDYYLLRILSVVMHAFARMPPPSMMTTMMNRFVFE